MENIMRNVAHFKLEEQNLFVCIQRDPNNSIKYQEQLEKIINEKKDWINSLFGGKPVGKAEDKFACTSLAQKVEEDISEAAKAYAKLVAYLDKKFTYGNVFDTEDVSVNNYTAIEQSFYYSACSAAMALKKIGEPMIKRNIFKIVDCRETEEIECEPASE